MKKYTILFIVIAFLCSKSIHSQTNLDLSEFNKSRNHKTANILKLVGVWAVGNMATSGYFYFNSKGSDNYFHQMNVVFNSANAVIVLTSLLPKQKNDMDLSKTLLWQSNTESTFIANAALDLLYSSVGLYLTEKAKNDFKNRDQWNGWGNSLILQGGFLFFIDTSMFIIHKKNGKKLYRMMEKVSIGTSGLGIKIGVHL